MTNAITNQDTNLIGFTQNPIGFTLNDFQFGVNMFNIIAGNTAKLTMQDLANQQKLISEEAHYEACKAFEDDDAVQLLDSVIDGLYVVLGQLQKLSLLGFDVQQAMKQVQEDNMKKFPTDEQVAVESVEMYKKAGQETAYKQVQGRFVLYNTRTGKVLKPKGFKPTDLSSFCPAKTISGLANK